MAAPTGHSAARTVKRILDVTVSGLVLTLLSSLFVMACLTIRLTSPGPVFFRQRRLGQDGREFEMLKFRTMTVNDDSDTRWSVLDDDRITAVGGLLRRSCLDELPQLFNVLRGDMSLVGPRPERPYFSQVFSGTVPGYTGRLRAPAGLTGWAQIHGLRGDTSIIDRARYDNEYIDDWSLFLDIKIVVRTGIFLFKWILLGRAPKLDDLGVAELGEPRMTVAEIPTSNATESNGTGLLHRQSECEVRVSPTPEGLQPAN
jgi:lipopolysaccharide/colanic/teichoic acid biosynthesis glycosyltransferase